MRHWLVVVAALVLLTWPASAQNSTSNRVPTDCSATITAGGTAQNLIAAGPGIGGFYIQNIDTTEPLWVRVGGTAAAAGTGSFALQAGATTTFAGAGSFYSAVGYNAVVSVFAATTGHKITCLRW